MRPRSLVRGRSIALLLALLLLAMQIPAGSQSTLAVYAAAALAVMICLVVLWRLRRGSIATPSFDGLQTGALALWLLWLAWIGFQLLPLPLDWLQALAPASAQAWQRALPYLDSPPPLTISLSPADTRWMLSLSIFYGLLYLLTVCCVRHPPGRRLLVYTLIAGAVLQSVFGTVMTASGIELGPFGPKHSDLGSATGTFFSRHHFAASLEVAAGLAIGLVLGELASLTAQRSWRGRMLNLIDGLSTQTVWLRISVLALAVGIVASRSRIGTLGLLAALLAASVYLLISGRGTRLRGLVFIATVVLVGMFVVVGEFGFDELLERFQSMQLGGEVRAAMFADLARMIGHYGFSGAGLGSFASIYPQFRSPQVSVLEQHAQCDYAELLIEVGFPGVVLLAMLVLTAVWRAAIVLARRRDRATLGIALGGLLALVCLGVHSLADSSLQTPANAATVVVVLALMTGLSPKSRSRRLAAAVGAEAEPEPEAVAAPPSAKLADTSPKRRNRRTVAEVSTEAMPQPEAVAPPPPAELPGKSSKRRSRRTVAEVSPEAAPQAEAVAAPPPAELPGTSQKRRSRRTVAKASAEPAPQAEAVAAPPPAKLPGRSPKSRSRRTVAAVSVEIAPRPEVIAPPPSGKRPGQGSPRR